MKRMDLKSRRALLSLALALVLSLCLTACGSPAGPAEAEADDELLVSDMASLDGVWSSDDGLSVLYFDSADGCYLYHSPYGSTGRGVFSNESGKPMIDFFGFLYDFYLNDDGVLQLNRNGSDGGKTPDLSGEKFRRDEEAQICTRYSEDGHFDDTFYRCEDAAGRLGN